MFVRKLSKFSLGWKKLLLELFTSRCKCPRKIVAVLMVYVNDLFFLTLTLGSAIFFHLRFLLAPCSENTLWIQSKVRRSWSGEDGKVWKFVFLFVSWCRTGSHFSLPFSLSPFHNCAVESRVNVIFWVKAFSSLCICFYCRKNGRWYNGGGGR